MKILYKNKIRDVKVLSNQIKHNSLVNCYLFYGPKGVGKGKLVLDFIKAIRCSSDNKRPCNQCDRCLAVEEKTDNDLIFINESDEIEQSSSIKIDQIRDLREKVSYKTYQGQHRIVVMNKANNLTNQAANSILKTLEEDSRTIFILTADSLSFPTTITSRAQLIYIPPYNSDISKPDKLDSFDKIANWTGMPDLEKVMEKMGVDTEYILKLHKKLNNLSLSDRLELVDDKLVEFGLENILLILLMAERKLWLVDNKRKRKENLDFIRSAISDHQRTNLNSKILLKNIFINYQ